VNTSEMTREQRTAHLSVHGWMPVALVGSVGIYHDQMGIGFVVGTGPSPNDPLAQRVDQVMQLRAGMFLPQFVQKDWQLVTDDILDKIDARLAEI
jgi:hypothetical protein